MQFHFIDECRDSNKLHSNLDGKELAVIEAILRAYKDGKIDFLEPRDKNKEPDPNGHFKLITSVSYKETGFELDVLKWYNDYIDTECLIDIIKSCTIDDTAQSKEQTMTIDEKSANTVTKRFNTCKITVRGSDVIISNSNNEEVTALTSAQWEELTAFVDNTMNYRNDVIDFLKKQKNGEVILRSSNVLNMLVEIYGNKRRENDGGDPDKNMSWLECLNAAFVEMTAKLILCID